MRRLPAILGLVLAALLVPASAPAAKPPAKPRHSQDHQTHGKRTPFEFQGAILARPTDTASDPTGTHKWNGPEAKGSPYCTAHFCVHWTDAAPDTSSASYAQQLGDILENEVYPCENGTDPTACAGGPGLGWRDPPPDYGLGGDDREDVYIEDLYSTERLYGYTARDPDQVQDPSVPHYSYMVMDNDYSRFGGSGGALAAERVTAAHEYNHVLQYGYDYLEDPWMAEATATYMEDKVYPGSNDYLNYVDVWVKSTKEPLTQYSQSDRTDLKAYGSAVWNHWLDHRFGSGAVRAAWEDSVGAADFAPGAYGAAIAGLGGGGFSDEFDRFATAAAEWDVPGAGFPDPYPDVSRDGTLAVGTQTLPFNLPHTTFEYLDVPIPPDAPPTIRLTGTLPIGTVGALALVGRTGGDIGGGTVTTSLTPMPSGGTAAVQLDNPSQFGRITAVIVNADSTVGGFDSSAGDYIWTHDATGVVAAMAEPGPPIPATGVTSQVTDHTAVINGMVDPHLNDTNWSIQYGPTVSYEHITPGQPLSASTVASAPVTSTVTGLAANTTYHYRVVATNAAGTTAGSDATFTTLPDVTPPKLLLKVKPERLGPVRRRGFVYLLRCSERCAGTAQIVVPASTARKLALPPTLGRARVTLPSRSRSTLLSVRLAPRVRRIFAAQKRGFRVILELRLSDQSHNKALAERTVRLR